MKKGKEWLKKEFDDLFNGKSILTVGRSVVDEILNQLDEPEVLSEEWIEENKEDSGVHYIGYYVPIGRLHDLLVPKQELPVIPKFVAEWIEFKKKSGIPYENVFQAINELVNSHTSKAHNWVLKTDENKDAFARAWLDGYTVEEPKYYVKDNKGNRLLRKVIKGFGIDDRKGKIVSSTKAGEASDFRLTEQEIKDYDPRYWAFRKPVEELEE